MSTDEPVNILIVDDNKSNLFSLHTLINDHIDAHIFQAESGAIALEILLQEQIDLIILDVQMPEMDGFELAQLIRSRKKTQNIPIVFLTANYKSEDFKKRGFAIGAVDYLTKPIEANQLISRIQSYLRFIKQERQHHQELERQVQKRTAEFLKANQKLQQEILERKQIEKKLQEAHTQLEQRVQERTVELFRSNQKLQTEIKERQAVEAALERISRQNQLILESAGEGIFSLDLEGNVILVNPAALKMLGYEKDELMGLNQHSIIHHTKPDGTPYPEDECPIYATIYDGKSHYRDDEVFWRKEGTCFPVEYTTTPILEKGQLTGVVVTFSDISQRKQNQAALEEAKNVAEEARAAAEIASRYKSRFLANMSHELRTPLNAIQGYSEMLIEDAKKSALTNFIPDLRQIHAAGKLLLGLVDDVLALSRIEAGKMELYLETFDISCLCKEVQSTIQPQMEKKHNSLSIKCDNAQGEMYADQTKFKQILLNLLSNAAKFTENGQVGLEVERKNKDNEDWIFLRVTDNGIGMTAEQQENLFEPFTQGDSSTTRKYGGTGLGLTITKEFTEMMGGSISLESEFGFGSTFTVSLPAIVSMPVIQQPTEELLLEGDGIVLVIDDEQIVRKLLRDYLSKLGYAVACAPDGKKGIGLAHKLRPDAIILDVKMQGVDGWDVLSTLKSNLLLADIPVIMMSVEEHQNKGFALGATDYMVKPVRQDQLTSVLNKFHIGDNSQDLVMVVEDDPYIREVMAENLKNAGLRVFKAENGKVALEHIDNRKPSLILLDLNMPVMNGFEFLSHLRKNQKWRSIPVVVLTASHLTSEEQAHLQGYVETIFEKETYDSDELLLQLHNLIADSK